MSPKVGETNIANKAIALETILEPYSINMNNISNFQRLELPSIPYYVN